MSTIGLYTKAILTALVSAMGAATTALQDGHIDTQEWFTIVIGLLIGGGLVWAIPNLSSGVARYGKAITAAVVAFLSALAAALLDGVITPNEWIIIFGALITGSGLVSIAPNAEVSTNFRLRRDVA